MTMFGNHFHNIEPQLPPGFRFHPTDEELIAHYLLQKALDSSFTSRAIAEVDLHKCEPWELPEKAKMGEEEWYFFSLRDRKYPTGLRTNRATGAGYWKATGKDKEIYSSRTKSLVGMKKTLVFYRGRAPKGEKSNWVMHEYRLEGRFAFHFLCGSSKDEWVISRVFKKCGTGSGGKKNRLALAGEGSYSDSTISAGSPSCGSLASHPDMPRFPAAATLLDQDSCFHESSEGEPVPCYSTAGPSFRLPFPHTTATLPACGALFPSLRAMQPGLQLPFYLSGLAPMPLGGSGGLDARSNHERGCPRSDLDGKAVSAARGHRMPLGASELDCIWTS
ncbi:unnamed protein product [Musa acuminata subsp. malaccensis]|uniref:(wild Malaysian banana) hypothetical protein n=1 Tax=Musa acuminata subsp. malaccensis TaxID=214687 RepID=A0A804L0H9_MUSAM|nr:PREDICTED: protein CUP-SHAPED COTYLEDON 1-like [Musa acuminata subsp. malaccensis]CAG1854631.1 unnamed protein product [Musa acuminata subsp. malaccensis]